MPQTSLLRTALVTVPAVLALGLLSGWLANSGYGNPWFDALRKPAIMPPGWVFGVVWTILYILLGVVLALLLQARGTPGTSRLIGLFLVQLVLNYAWSPTFFALHKVSLALAMIAAMIALTVALILLLFRDRRLAALLLMPYLAWLGFATALNFEILMLNPDAEYLVPAPANPDIRA